MASFMGFLLESAQQPARPVNGDACLRCQRLLVRQGELYSAGDAHRSVRTGRATNPRD